jgi:hypothetical protein
LIDILESQNDGNILAQFRSGKRPVPAKSNDAFTVLKVLHDQNPNRVIQSVEVNRWRLNSVLLPSRLRDGRRCPIGRIRASVRKRCPFQFSKTLSPHRRPHALAGLEEAICFCGFLECTNN